MITNYLNDIFNSAVSKGVVSNPLFSAAFKRVNINKVKDLYQVEKFTQKQAFTENLTKNDLLSFLNEIAKDYKQFDFWNEDKHFLIKVSKKGKATLLTQKGGAKTEENHNREKHYILKEAIPPLVDLGIFTKEGKIVHSMYDKYKQINRFTEIVKDVLGDKKKMTILDFGCGKSYLTFILYHFLVNIARIDAEIIGLDLKEDVIKNCNALSEKYGYKKLRFETGDIGTFKFTGKVDMIITLHACDTATDFALYNAIKWDCGTILSVPCCQHELNSQIKPENFEIFSRYGLIKERFSALATDAIRGNLLTAQGYKTELMEFVDMAHSPKNILIRARKTNIPQKTRDKAKAEAEMLMKEFSFSPTLYNLLYGGEK